MLSFFRKSSSKPPSIMTGPNTSETTLVSTSLSTTPLSTTNSSSKSNNSFMSEPGKFTPTQPFLGSNNKSVVQERLGTAQSMFPASQSQRLSASEELEQVFTPTSLMMGAGGFVVRFGKQEIVSR
ncbi:uncharacterized protein UHOD_02008 [Ustilago sp. UG-2017b]|nr:uncharacterized protein UHOD_02008 [Ustilago sp. UG-2017b]